MWMPHRSPRCRRNTCTRRSSRSAAARTGWMRRASSSNRPPGTSPKTAYWSSRSAITARCWKPPTRTCRSPGWRSAQETSSCSCCTATTCCNSMSVDHYENFPVASILMPRRLRKPVAAIYHFARAADDIADEGGLPDEERLTQLFLNLAAEIREHVLPLQPFYDLLDAFSQDVMKKRHADFGELLDYCRRSANPVGTLLLHLYGEATPVNLAYSDAICTSLQLINFWQDVAKDYAIGRIYLPQDEMNQYGVNEEQIAQGIADDAWRRLMQFQVSRARGSSAG